MQRQIAALIVESIPFSQLMNRLVAWRGVILSRREFASAGRLVSYGSSLTEAYAQVGRRNAGPVTVSIGHSRIRAATGSSPHQW